MVIVDGLNYKGYKSFLILKLSLQRLVLYMYTTFDIDIQSFIITLNLSITRSIYLIILKIQY